MSNNYRTWLVVLLFLLIASLGASTYAVIAATRSNDQPSSSDALTHRKSRAMVRDEQRADVRMDRPAKWRGAKNIHKPNRTAIKKYQQGINKKQKKIGNPKFKKIDKKFTSKKSNKNKWKFEKIRTKEKKPQSLGGLVQKNKITQAQADEKWKALTDKCQAMVDAGQLTQEQADKKLRAFK